MFKIIVSLVLASMLSACAGVDFGSPNTYQRYDVQHSGTVEEGTEWSLGTAGWARLQLLARKRVGSHDSPTNLTSSAD
jgi:hypothetical protein